MVIGPVDPLKDAQNIQKHGVSLRVAEGFTADALVVAAKTVKGERRFMVIGRIGARVYAGAATTRAGRPRFISLRLASRKERRLYDGS